MQRNCKFNMAFELHKAGEIRHSLVVDSQELRKSEMMRSEAAKAAADIAQRMAAYMAGPTE